MFRFVSSISTILQYIPISSSISDNRVAASQSSYVPFLLFPVLLSKTVGATPSGRRMLSPPFSFPFLKTRSAPGLRALKVKSLVINFMEASTRALGNFTSLVVSFTMAPADLKIFRPMGVSTRTPVFSSIPSDSS